MHGSSGDINVYPPKVGDPRDRFTVELTAAGDATPAPPLVRKAENTVAVDAPPQPVSMLVRVPDGVSLRVETPDGNIGVTNITGSVDAHTGKGSVTIMVPGYAQATVGTGSLNVTNGAQSWPGTLHYSVDTGDVVLYVLQTAKFHIRMQTQHGTLFNDFGLRGSSEGSVETIEGDVNGGGPESIDIRVGQGNIRVLRLAPQA